VDYRGVPVIAAALAVPDSPWFMIAKRDLTEITAPMRERLWQIVVLVGILLLGAGAGVGLLWRQQRMRFYREHAKSAEALQKSQDLLAQAEKLGKVGGWEFDIETRLLTWTKTVYDIHELDSTGQQTVDQGVNFYTPASRPIIERAVQRAIEQGEPFDLELEIITAKGNLRSVHVIGRADLARRKVSGFFQDITERKQAEEALRESEEKFRTLVTNLSSGVVVHAPDTSVIFSNPMASTLLGLTKDQMSGKQAIDPAWSFLRENGMALPLAEYPVNRVMSSGAPILNQVLGIHRPDLAEPVWVQCSAYTDTAVDGTLLQVVVAFSDITERKRVNETLLQSRRAALNLMTDAVAARERAEQMSKALHENEQKYRTLFETADDAILLFAEGIWVDCNAGALKIFGCTRVFRRRGYQEDQSCLCGRTTVFRMGTLSGGWSTLCRRG
jgi:PAS domain-containing protein